MNPRGLLVIVVLLAVVIGSFMIKRPQTSSTDAAPETELPEGYYLTGVRLTGLSTAGTSRYELRAERVEHRPADNSIELARLALDYGDAEKPWTILAASGRMPASNDSVHLSGGVRIENPSLASAGAASVTSDSLLVDFAGETASTTDPVNIVIGRGALDGVGMEVDFANETLRIVSNVHGVFDPSQP